MNRGKMRRQREISMRKTMVCLGLLIFFCWGISLSGETIAIRGGEIHTMNGEILKSGIILIREGKIVDIGENVQIPEGIEVIDAQGYILYPGFVAPSGLFTPEGIRNFESFSPQASALDRFDFHGDYIQYLRGGITSAFVAMPANRIISGKGAVVKLGGGGKKALLLREEAALNVNLGKEAILPPMTDVFPAPVSPENPLTPSFRQFPSSSLGAHWLLHELFRFDAYSGELARYFQSISHSLEKAQEQDLPLIVRCQKASDILQAIQFSKTVNMPLVIQGAAEAYRLADILKENHVSVIAEAHVRPNGLFTYQDSGEKPAWGKHMRSIPALIQKGILVSITPDDERYLPDLFWVAQYFQKFGISEEKLVETITINSAKIFGLEGKIGNLGKGRDADILFFKKARGAPLPRLEKVMREGQFVYEE